MKTSTTISPVLDSKRYSKHSNIAKTTYQEGYRYNSVYTTEIKSSSKEPGECSTSKLLEWKGESSLLVSKKDTTLMY